jgi:hypothetical protein
MEMTKLIPRVRALKAVELLNKSPTLYFHDRHWARKDIEDALLLWKLRYL